MQTHLCDKYKSSMISSASSDEDINLWEEARNKCKV